MTIISLLIGKKGHTLEDTVILTHVFCLKDYYYFQKKTVKEMCIFAGRNLIFRTESGKFSDVEHGDYNISSMSIGNLSICAILNDDKYPLRVMHRFLRRTLDNYRELHGEKCEMVNTYLGLPMENLSETLEKAQNPNDVDKMYNITQMIESTKEIMKQNIEKVLERGENIDELVQRSKDLSKSSKDFYRTSKKFNRCCIIS